MRLQVSEQTISDICEPFGTENDQVVQWCEWMAKFHKSDQAEKNTIIDGVVLNSAKNVAILGARRVFNAKGLELVKHLQNQPDFEDVRKAIYSFILHIEGTLIPPHVMLETFLKAGKDASLAISSLRSEPGSQIVTVPGEAYEKLKTFINETFLNDNCLYNNEKYEGLTNDQDNLLKVIRVDVAETKVNFANWNEIIVTGLVKLLDTGILKPAEPELKAPALRQIDNFLRQQNFISLTLEEIKSIRLVLATFAVKFVTSFNKVTLKPVVAVGRTQLAEDEIQRVVNGVTYQGVHPLIARPIEEIVRRNLATQLKDVKLEGKFVPELAHEVAEQFTTSRLHKGHRVGTIAAMSAGEDASQSTLRSYHHAGVSGSTGFQRVKEITDNQAIDKVKKGFTIVALKGTPDEQQAHMYSHQIEETTIGDICEIVVGRTNPDVPDVMGDLETPVFEAEEGGWQNRYIKLIETLVTKPKSSGRPSFKRPDWIVRLICDQTKMYQKRITPTTIAENIEHGFSDMRAIASDFKTGLIDIYIDTSNMQGGDFGISGEYNKLTMHVIPNLVEKLVQGVVGFSKVIVEKFDIATFCTVKSDGKKHIVTFNEYEVKVNGVHKDQIEAFITNKAGKQAEVVAMSDHVYEVNNFEGKFRERILAPEVVKLSDLVVSRKEQDDSLVITLNKDTMLYDEDISVLEVLQFFQKQNDLVTFASVDIAFNRTDFTVKLTKSKTFTLRTLAAELQRFGVSEDIEIEEDHILYKNVNSNANYEGFQTAIRGYGSILNTNVDRAQETIRVSYHPMSLMGAWGMLEEMQSCYETIPITFQSRRRQKIGENYRILTKGFGIEKLAQLDFVNIYATHSSIPREHFQFFDIEATRDYTASELILNMGGDVGSRHLGLIADVMCYIGSPIKLKLSGKKATMGGPMATAYMEQSFKLMADSAAGNRIDDLRSAVSMTLIGDFNRGAYGAEKKTTDKIKVESALDIMMGATVSTRTQAPVTWRSGEPQASVDENEGEDEDDPFANY